MESMSEAYARRDDESDSLRRFLVVCDDNSGFVGLSNVCVVEAHDSDDAKDKVVDKSSVWGKFKAYDIDGIPDGWSYYE